MTKVLMTKGETDGDEMEIVAGSHLIECSTDGSMNIAHSNDTWGETRRRVSEHKRVWVQKRTNR